MKRHRKANIGRFKKRRRIRTEAQKLKRREHSKEHHYEEELGYQVVSEYHHGQSPGLLPPARDEPAYIGYLSILSKPPCKDYVVNNYTILPPNGDKWYQRMKPNYKFIYMIESGEVWQCKLHKVWISQEAKKYSLYRNKDDCIPVKVHFGRLLDTLIPIDIYYTDTPSNCAKCLNESSFLSDYDCYIEKKSGMRVFFKDRQKYFRIGDVLSNKVIYNCLKWSGWSNTSNFVFFCSDCCRYVRKQNQLRMNRINKPAYSNPMPRHLDKAADDLIRFLSRQMEAFENDPPKKQIRNDWTKWSVIDQSNFCSMNYEMRQYCINAINNIQASNPSIDLDALVLLHRVIPMLASQEVMDEKLHEYYLAVTQGRFTVEQWVLPLQTRSAFEYYNILADTTSRYSMQHKKAERLLVLMAVTACMFGGQIPTKFHHLEAFPEMGPKKIAVALNSIGYYDKVKLGVDTHVKDCFSYFLHKHGMKSDEKNLIRLASCVPANIGLKTNEYCAETGQQLMRGDRKWARRHWETMINNDKESDDTLNAIKWWSSQKKWMKVSSMKKGDTVMICDKR